MYTIEQMEKDLEDGKVREVVIGGRVFKLSSVDFKRKQVWLINTSGCIAFKYIDLEATQKLVKGDGKMKFKKEDLNTRFVVKLRNGMICMLGETTPSTSLIIFNKNDFGEDRGVSYLDGYTDDLLIEYPSSDYDIMAIKEYESTSEAYNAVLNDKVKDWDWVRGEKTKSQIEYEQMQNDLKSLQDKMDKFANENNLA